MSDNALLISSQRLMRRCLRNSKVEMLEQDSRPRLARAALGARLRRLSAQIDAEASRVYAAKGIAFEQRWFGVLDALARDGPQSVNRLAARLGITHASVSQTRDSLARASLIETADDALDRRRRMLSLSDHGKHMVAELAPLWASFDVAALELDTEVGGLIDALDRLDAALAHRSLGARVEAAFLQLAPSVDEDIE